MTDSTVGCVHHGCSGGKRDTYLTWPNLVTVVRTLLAVGLALGGVAAASIVLLFAGLAAYWVGDIADGVLARTTGTETRTGAVLDVVADRLCVAVFYLGYAVSHPELLAPVAVFLVTFMLVDTMLSLAFLNWPLLSANYFYLVDRRLYLLNWSPVAKALNGGLLLVVMVVSGSPAGTLGVAVTQLVVKTYSTVRLVRLPPAPAGPCASPV